MKSHIYRYLFLSLLVLLSSSSFSINDYLIQKLQQHDFTSQQLDYALTNSIPLAYQLKRKQFKQGTASWLHYSIKLAKYRSKVALELASFFSSNLTNSLTQQEKNKKIVFWINHAILLGSERAKVRLAEYYYRQNDIDQAKKTINRLTTLSIASAPITAKIAITAGSIEQLTALLPLLAQSSQGKKLLKKIEHFNVLSTNEVNNNSLSQQAATYKLTANPQKKQFECANSIQFFATNINDLLYSETLIKQFKQQNTQTSLQQNICFAPVRYRSIKQLHCSTSNAKTKSLINQRIMCDERQWQKIALSIKTKYVAVLLPQGGANVHLGILYLDRYDNVDVFVHEISHLLGFVDEYPLPTNHQNCQQYQKEIFANNIAVLARVYQGSKAVIRQKVLSQLAWGAFIKNSTPILQRVKTLSDGDNLTKIEQWQLGTPTTYNQEVGLFLSESCDNTQLQAFKPLYKQTKLRYFEKALPILYSQILTLQGNKYNMPSFHYNIALALQRKNKDILMPVWLKKAAEFEKDSNKKIKILTASF